MGENLSVKVIEFDRLEYCFHDSSVPPKYHRSYTISVSSKEISKLIDSYGDTVSFEKREISPEEFKSIQKTFVSAKIKNCKKKRKGDGCTGGTGISIHCYLGAETVFTGHNYTCAGEEVGDLCGETNKINNQLNVILQQLEGYE